MTSRKGVLSDIFKNEAMDIESMTKKFMKKLKRILHQCFDKVRVKDKDNKEITNFLIKEDLSDPKLTVKAIRNF